MDHDWLLVETLGDEPAVVAQGARTKNLVPISSFLRRNPHLMAIQSAIGETVRAGHALSIITPKHDRVIRTEVVHMSDGVIHGVHLWIGPPDAEPPERPIPGPLKWDLTSGVATDTPESLANAGRDIATRHMPASIPTMMLVIGSVTVNLFGGAALGIGESWLWPTLEGWLTTIGAGIASVFAYLLIVVALRGRDLSLTAPFRYTVIVWAVLYGVVIWGDSLDFLTIVGACLIVASGVFMLYRERKLAQTSEENAAG